ncbi:cation:proton antiporter [Bartonella sp. DGB1]|uniref:cation:proton antiporter n=1 Tax=Bartonella sp. DGB1 TaxID=3239807 RepID=UPI003523FF76
MTHIPLWLTILVSIFMLCSCLVILITSIYFCLIKSYFSKLQILSMAVNLGLFLIVLAVVCYFGWFFPTLIFKLSLLFIFVFLTSPIGMIMLAFLGWQQKKK